MDRKPDQSDRERLKQIEQSDLSESRVNEDFVQWLKTKGPNYLLIILAALCVYMLITRWQQAKVQKSAEAWEALTTADLPRSKEDVAEEYEGIPGVPEMARLTAGRQYLQSVRADSTIASLMEQMNEVRNQSQQQQFQPNRVDVTEPLTDEQREQNLAEAERLFQSVYDGVRDVDVDATPGRLLLKLCALDGLAAVAESRNEPDKAKQYYEQFAEAADTKFPKLAKLARNRAENVESVTAVASLPTVEQVGQRAILQNFESADTPQQMLPSLQRIINTGDASPPATPGMPATIGNMPPNMR